MRRESHGSTRTGIWRGTEDARARAVKPPSRYSAAVWAPPARRRRTRAVLSGAHTTGCEHPASEQRECRRRVHDAADTDAPLLGVAAGALDAFVGAFVGTSTDSPASVALSDFCRVGDDAPAPTHFTLADLERCFGGHTDRARGGEYGGRGGGGGEDDDVGTAPAAIGLLDAAIGQLDSRWGEDDLPSTPFGDIDEVMALGVGGADPFDLQFDGLFDGCHPASPSAHCLLRSPPRIRRMREDPPTAGAGCMPAHTETHSPPRIKRPRLHAPSASIHVALMPTPCASLGGVDASPPRQKPRRVLNAGPAHTGAQPHTDGGLPAHASWVHPDGGAPAQGAVRYVFGAVGPRLDLVVPCSAQARAHIERACGPLDAPVTRSVDV